MKFFTYEKNLPSLFVYFHNELQLFRQVSGKNCRILPSAALLCAGKYLSNSLHKTYNIPFHDY